MKRCEKRKPINLTEECHALLSARAKATGKAMEDLLRSILVDHFYGRGEMSTKIMVARKDIQ